MLKRWPALLALVLASVVLTAQPRLAVPAATAATGFAIDTIVNGLEEPTAVAFAPDGRIFITEKNGKVRLVKDGVLRQTPFVNLEGQVNHWWDRGLLGIALDPDFPNLPYVYLYYVREDDSGVFEGPRTARVARVRAEGDQASSNVEIILGRQGGIAGNYSCDPNFSTSDCIPADSMTHNGGALRFDSAGKLWVAIGDGAQFQYDYTAGEYDLRALRAQNVDSLSGKVLRINKNSGQGFSDNPFASGNLTANRSKVWAYGLRNPFRFGLRPGSDLPYIGDVGSEYVEEVNLGTKGANLGWPCWEGSRQDVGFDTTPACRSRYNAGGVTFPVWSYGHTGTAHGAVTGGVFYAGGSYPAENDGAYFVGDYVRGFLKRLKFSVDHQLISVEDFDDDVGAVVDLVLGPGGDIYFITFGESRGALKRIRSTSGGGGANDPPVASASANRTGGAAPLEVRFSSAGSYDPDGNILSFAWSFGNGSSSSQPNPTHTYRAGGDYRATLTVSDGKGGSDTATVDISVGNAPPALTITSPRVKLTYAVGQSVQIDAAADDPEEGHVPAENYAWKVNFWHCTGNDCHLHPSYKEGSGPRGSFTIDDHGGPDNYLEVFVTAWDSEGNWTTKSVIIRQRTVTLKVTSVPVGALVRLAGQSTTAPFTTRMAVGARRALDVPSPQVINGQSYTFSRWSDGGGSSRVLDFGDGKSKNLKLTLVRGS